MYDKRQKYFHQVIILPKNHFSKAILAVFTTKMASLTIAHTTVMKGIWHCVTDSWHVVILTSYAIANAIRVATCFSQFSRCCCVISEWIAVPLSYGTGYLVANIILMKRCGKALRLLIRWL